LELHNIQVIGPINTAFKLASSHKVTHRDTHKMNISDKVPCLYSQDNIVKSDLYKTAVLPVILPISVLTCLLTTFTNLIVVSTIIKTPTLHFPSNFLILGMAISDLGVGAFAQPFYTATLFYELYHDLRYYCKVYDIFYNITWIMGSTSVLTLNAFTTDRFVAVYYHMRYAEIVTSRRVGIALLVIWVYTIGCWVLYFLIAECFFLYFSSISFLCIYIYEHLFLNQNQSLCSSTCSNPSSAASSTAINEYTDIEEIYQSNVLYV